MNVLMLIETYGLSDEAQKVLIGLMQRKPINFMTTFEVRDFRRYLYWEHEVESVIGELVDKHIVRKQTPYGYVYTVKFLKSVPKDSPKNERKIQHD